MAFVKVLLGILLLLTAVFLIVLVLIQRGKGGGLAGAFGGMGGQSAFGTKAGDLFTRITIGVAAFWIMLCMVTVKVLGIGGQGPLDRASSAVQRERQAGRHRPGKARQAVGSGKGTTAPAPAKPPRSNRGRHVVRWTQSAASATAVRPTMSACT